MRSEEWQQVEELLDAALDLAPDERRRFLDEVAKRAPELRREVESLLVCEERADKFLAAPALAYSSDFFDDANAAEDRAGQVVGNYKIVREIGRGGMGAVFLAERSDGEFEQQVALKVVRRSFADSELARRFRRERQILASLNHPNIARLMDGGVSADGEPFFAMEYVEGVRIDDYCNAKNLSTEERLQLFLAVCRGVAYAHQHLVVHRDIKPSNILVTKDGAPKLLDFGIAKLLDAEHPDEHTQTAFRAFTPDYASPEQMSGASVTTASDVYSLGVLLQDLLGGAPSSSSSPDMQLAPGGWRSETPGQKTKATNLATNQEDGKRRERSNGRRFVSAELGNISAMARREEPARRYASVAGFAEDVQRYLDGRPVRAQKDSVTYRMGKFVRRNKLAVGAGLLVALSLVAGLALALWQAGVVRQERDRAERRFNDVRKLSNSLLFEITPKLERLEGSTEAREVLVTRALEYLDSLSQEAGDDLQLQSELAAAYEKIGSLQGDALRPNLGDFGGAITSYEKAQAIRRKLLPVLPADVENRRRLAENLRMLSLMRFGRNEIARSLENSNEALRLYESLTRANPDSTKLQTAYLETQIEHSQGSADNGQYAEAIPPLRQAIGKLEELRQKNPDDTEVLRVLAKGLASLGHDLSWNNQQAEAEAEMARAIQISESLVAANPNDANLRQRLWAIYLVASGIYDGIDDARSLELSRQALRVVEETIALDKANVQARNNQAKTLSRLGVSSANLGKTVEALTYLERSARVLTELIENDPTNTSYNRSLGVNYQRLGDARYKKRDLAGALVEFEKGSAIYQKIYEADQTNLEVMRDTAIIRKSIGYIYDDLARAARGETANAHLQTAKENYKQALEILSQLQSNNSLAEVDRKLLEEMQAAVRKYE